MLRLSEAGLHLEPGSRAAGFLTFEAAAHAPVRIPVVAVQGRQSGPTLWVQASLHGDEVDGVVAVLRWIERASFADLRGAVLAVPVLNMPAFLAGTAAHPADGVNLNRAFGSAGDTWTERFASWLLPIIAGHADAFVDLHGGGRDLEVEHFAFCDAAHKPSRELAAASGVRYVCTAPAGHAGALYRVLAGEGIPAVLVEAGGGTAWREDAVRLHQRAVDNVLGALGMIERPSPAAPQPPPPLIERTVELHARDEAAVVRHAAVGAVVALGETVVELRTLTGEAGPSISSPLPSAVLLSVAATARLRPGGSACLLGELAS
ncbi:MAG TPA: succinylglutamate desuccinylase/aspartoacylase family protein [bacterium]|nr:succinylglutamate desuccinylase/aspartoacylase family protein [bacterium]